MENSPFREKIQREHQVVLKQLSKFRNIFQGKAIEPAKIQTYCNFIGYISTLYSTYIHNCMQYFTPSMKQEIIRINKSLLDDMSNKLRSLSNSFQLYNCQKPNSKTNSDICQLCHSKIRQIDVKIIRQQLADDAYLRKSLLKKIYSDMENQNEQLFTKDEDEMFFQFLNRILIKKEEVLSMQTKEINDFLVEVTKSFSDLNFLTEYTPVKLSSTQYKDNYKEQMQKTLTQSLKTGFESKVHPWVQKVFQKLKKYLKSQQSMNSVQEAVQTSDQLMIDINKKRIEYSQTTETKQKLQQLKDQVQRNQLQIDQLRSKLTVLEKQKRQLEEFYAKEIEELLLGKRKVQYELKKTQNDFHSLRQSKNIEIAQLQKRLRKKSNRTEPNQKQSTSTPAQDTPPTVQFSQTVPAPKSNQDSQPDLFSTFKKKKSHLKRLISKKSQVQRSFLNDNNQISIQREVTTSQKPQQQQVIGKSSEDFLKEIKMNKKKSKLISQNDQKVQLSLDQQVSGKKQNQINIITQVHETKSQIDQIPSTPKIIKKKSSKPKSKKTQRSPKRMLSIQMKMPPMQIKAMGQTFLNKKPKDQQKSNHSPKTSNFGSQERSKRRLTQKKKLFEYVPFENNAEYQDLKDIVGQINSRIEEKTTDKLKASIKQIKDPEGIGSLSQVGKLYGFSIFNKKGTEKQKQVDKSREQSRIHKSSKEKSTGKSVTLHQNHSKSKNKLQNSKSKEYKVCVTAKEVDSAKQEQTYSISAYQTIGIQTSQSHLLQDQNIINTISLTERKQLYEVLKQESLLAPSLSFHHYELLVRKIFALNNQGLASNQASNLVKYHKQRNSSNFDGLNQKKQKQSVKINIDSKFLDQVKVTKNPSKILLNLPKLNNQQLNNGRNSSTFAQNPNNKSSFNMLTVREKPFEDSVFNISELKPSPSKQNKQNILSSLSNHHSSLLKPLNIGSNQIFTVKDIRLLFQNQLLAYQYQKCSKHSAKHSYTQMTSRGDEVKPQSTKYSFDLTPESKSQLQSLFSLMNQLRHKNHELYHKVCSFIKYPYSSARNGFDFVNIGKDLTFQDWIRYFSKMYQMKLKAKLQSGMYHCSNQQKVKQKSLEKHHDKSIHHNENSQHFLKWLKPFEQKLVQLFLTANKRA